MLKFIAFVVLIVVCIMFPPLLWVGLAVLAVGILSS
jgi:hypothetical protein